MLPSLLLVGLIACSQDSYDLEPILEGCRLVLQEEEVEPLACEPFLGLQQVSAEGWRVLLTGSMVWITREGGPKPARSIAWPESQAHGEPRCIVVSGGTAWFTRKDEPSCKLLRLDLERGEWLPTLRLDDESLGVDGKGDLHSEVRAVLPTEDSIVILREDTPPDLSLLRHSRTGSDITWAYIVARIDVPSGKPVWTRRFEGAPFPPMPHSGLIGPMPTPAVATWTRPLQLFAGGVLVCVGGCDDLQLLDIKSGTPRWSLDHLWEYQLGYIGPSVWSHFLGRFGERGEGERASESERRDAFEEGFSGSVVAGPFLVNKSSQYSGPEQAALIVVAISPRSEWASQLAQQYVYEVDARGQPCSMVALPRAALGWAAVTHDDCVTVACLRGGWACASSTKNTGDISMLVGSRPDAVGAMRWYREPEPTSPRAWMTCEPAGDPIATGSRLAVRAAGGGWIAARDQSLFHFPLQLVDLREGSVREGDLRVPFAGRMTQPETGFRIDADGIHTFGPRGLWVTSLELSAGRLLVRIANSARSWMLEFDATALGK